MLRFKFILKDSPKIYYYIDPLARFMFEGKFITSLHSMGDIKLLFYRNFSISERDYFDDYLYLNNV